MGKPSEARLGAAVAVTVAALPLAAVAVVDPSLATRLLVLAVVAVGALCAPTWVTGPALVAGTAIVPTVIAEANQGAGSGAAQTVFGGQARWLTVVLIFVAWRALLGRDVPNIRHRGAVAILASTAGFLLAAAIGLLQSRSYSGDLSALSRDLTYPLAAIVAVAALQDARRRGREASLYRVLAWISIVVGLLSVAYWASTEGLFHIGQPFETWFSNARGTSGPHVFQSSRSIFPFVQDSPNLGAVAITMLAWLVIPILLALRNRRDTALAVAVAVSACAGVIATQSRTGLLAFAAAAAIFTWMTLRRRGVARVNAAMAIITVAAVVLGTYAAILGTSTTSSGNVNDRSLSAHTATLGAREAIWKQALTAVLKQPTGYGYQYSIHGDFVEPTSGGGAVAARQQGVHQQFFAELVDGGLIGLVLFLVPLAIMVNVARDRRNAPSAHRIALAAVLAAALTGMAGNTVSQSAACQTLLWLTFGFALVRARLPTREPAFSAA